MENGQVLVKGGNDIRKSLECKFEKMQLKQTGEKTSEITEIQRKKMGLVHSFIKMCEWDDAQNMLNEVLQENPYYFEANWAQILINHKAKVSDELMRGSFTEYDYEVLTRGLDCANETEAKALLKFLYEYGKTVDENGYERLLAFVLPYEYGARAERIKEAFSYAIEKDFYGVFTLLITTLDYYDIDEYVKYTLAYANSTRSEARKLKCVSDILEVHPKNTEALGILFSIQLKSKNTKKVVETIGVILEVSENRNGEVFSLLKKCTINEVNKRCAAAVKKALEYYTGSLLELESELLTFAYLLIQKGCFSDAEYFLRLLIENGGESAEIYWGVCLAKIGARTDGEVVGEKPLLKSMPEYRQYLLLEENETSRLRCISLAKEQASYEKKAKKKRVVGIVLASIVSFVTLLGVIGGVSSCEQKEFNFQLIEGKNTYYDYYEISGYSGEEEEIIIPFDYKGIPVKGISDYAFMNNENLKRVTIPNSITYIGRRAFLKCSSLISVDIPDSVVSVEISAFNGCSSLESLRIPTIYGGNIGYIFGAKSYTENMKYMPYSLTKVFVTGGEIPMCAFYGCEKLQTVMISKGVSYVGENAFWGCSNLGIYCETTYEPSNWAENWNPDNRPVYWGNLPS